MTTVKLINWHDWNCTLCNTDEELEKFMSDNKVYGKTISGINVIGIAQNMEKSNYIYQLRSTLADLGTSFEAMDCGKVPDMELTPFPCEVTIHEPVVVGFSDGTTLEMQMCRKNEIKISVNQLSLHECDGINFSNFNANVLFDKLIGSSIKGTHIIEKTIVDNYDVSRSFRKLEFESDGKYGFYIQNDYDSMYKFGMNDHNSHGNLGRKTSLVSYMKIEKAAILRQQAVIVDGTGWGGCFVIMPIKAVFNKQEVEIEEYDAEEIAIDEDDVYCMLYYFLDKFYNPSLQKHFRDVQMYGLDFEWNLEHNVYTYTSIRKMLSSIREFSKLLCEDYNNPKLNDLKNYFVKNVGQFDSEYYDYKKRPNGEETVRNNIYVATEFYERFCHRMEIMMENAPQYKLISFMGP